jgi:hypothetical protein
MFVQCPFCRGVNTHSQKNYIVTGEVKDEGNRGCNYQVTDSVESWNGEKIYQGVSH